MCIVAGLLLVALFAPILSPHPPNLQHADGLTETGRSLAPSSRFPLGTDPLGRDLLSRLLHGARVSMTVGIGANAIAATVGLLLGGLGGMARGVAQNLAMRTVDVILGFPVILIGLAILAVTSPTVTSIILIIGVTYGAYMSRVIFPQVVSLREREFVRAAEIANVSRAMIFTRHVVPHVLPSMIVLVALGIVQAVMLEAAFSYVGIGVQLPDASWGNMVSQGQSFLTSQPRLVLVPGGAIMLAMFGFTLTGDALRDAMDPNLELRMAKAAE